MPRDHFYRLLEATLDLPLVHDLVRMLRAVRALGYDADASLELFDAGFEALWSADPAAAARNAYERCTALAPDCHAAPLA